MRFGMPLIAAGALAAALSFGAQSPATATAAEKPQLNAFYVLDQDAFCVRVVVDAPPELGGAFCSIRQGMQPFSGPEVAALMLMPGPNLAMAPQMGPCWFTAKGPEFPARTVRLNEVPGEE